MVQNPNPEKHWRIRRYTMFASIFLIVVLTIGFAVIGLHNPAALTAMSAVVGWVYGALSIPLLGYYGNTAVEEYAKNRKQ